MRYDQLVEGRPWKTYYGRKRTCLMASHRLLGDGMQVVSEAEGSWGSVWTGRTEVFWGYFVRLEGPAGESWLGEDRRSIRQALVQAAAAAEANGWSLLAIGLTDEWQESGLSGNTGYGSHPGFPDRHVHMLEPPPSPRLEARRNRKLRRGHPTLLRLDAEADRGTRAAYSDPEGRARRAVFEPRCRRANLY